MKKIMLGAMAILFIGSSALFATLSSNPSQYEETLCAEQWTMTPGDSTTCKKKCKKACCNKDAQSHCAKKDSASCAKKAPCTKKE